MDGLVDVEASNCYALQFDHDHALFLLDPMSAIKCISVHVIKVT
jgi:hypothetical protein